MLLPCRTRMFVAGAVVLGGISGIVSAAEDELVIETIEVYGQAIESYLTDEMNTSTRLGLSSLETPQSVSAITRVQMDDFGLNSLNGALTSTTGVLVESVETDRTYYTSRGFDIANFQLDGVGVPMTYGNIEGDIDTAIFERIEIVRGANGLMSGAGNPSATVNMIRKRPTEEFNLAVTGTVGAWDKKRVDADISGALTDEVNGRFVVAQENRDSYLDNYGQDRFVGYGVVEMNLSQDTQVSAGLSHQSSKADSPLWGALPLFYTDGSATDYDRSTSTSADWAYWDSIETRAFAEVIHHFSDNWRAKLHYSHTDIDGDSELFYVYGTPDPVTELGLFGYASAYTLDERRDLLDLYLTGTFTLFDREHDLVAGVNWSQVDVKEVSLYDYTTGAGFPALGNFRSWNGDTPRPVFRDGETGSDWNDEQSSLYVASRLHLTDALSFVGGVRVTDWESEGYGYGESQATKVSGKTLPYAGLVYRFGEHYSVYASYTETFMPQRDIGSDLKRLAPAEGVNKELGVKGSFFESRLIASLALFQTSHDNVSEYAYFDIGSGQSIYEGIDYESEGFEVELSGELAPGLQASIGYTQLDIEDGSGDESRTFVPKKMLRFYTSYRLPMLDQLKIGAGLNWQDDIHRDVPGGITIEQDGYALVNVFANYSINENLDIAVTLNNLTDKKYINSLYWDQGYYGAPRNASVSVSWRY